MQDRRWADRNHGNQHESESRGGLNGVQASILQGVRPEFCHKTDAGL